MSSTEMGRGKDYVLPGAIVGLICYLVLALLLSRLSGVLAGLLIASILMLPAALTASFAGGSKYRAAGLSILVFATWLTVVITGFLGWGNNESYEGGDELAFWFVTACATLVAIASLAGIGVGYGLGLRGSDLTPNPFPKGKGNK
jgi:hypothetical protein